MWGGGALSFSFSFFFFFFLSFFLSSGFSLLLSFFGFCGKRGRIGDLFECLSTTFCKAW